MRKTYTTQVRVLLCQTCGAPLEVASGGGTIACAYCRAQNQVTRKRADVAIAPPSMPIDENTRQHRLRMQDGRPFVVPPSLQPLVASGGFHPAKVEEAFHIYQATRREVETTHSPEAGERLFALTLIANNHLGTVGDGERRRAILETSLETLSLPRHVQVLSCLLASASAKEGDVASAEQWLAPCNPRSDDLDADSAFRVARAFVDTTRGDFQAVLNNLGPYDDAYPIADTWDPTCALLRANALEKLGDVQSAVTALRTRMAKENQGGRAIMESIVRAHPQLALCPQSFPMATHVHAHHAAHAVHSSSGGGIGTIFYYTGIGLCVFGVVLGVILALSIGGAAMASGDEAGAIVGVVVGGITAVSVLPFGLVFAFIGRAFKKKGERAAWLRVNGIQAQGTVRSISPTGVSINNVPMVRVEVQVSHPNGAPYVASFERLFDPGMAAALQPGAIVPLRVHPEQPGEIILEST